MICLIISLPVLASDQTSARNGAFFVSAIKPPAPTIGRFFVSSDPAIPAKRKAPTVALFALYANHYRPRRKTGCARAILSAFCNHKQPIVLPTIKSA
jgi:hypothetical protein